MGFDFAARNERDACDALADVELNYPAIDRLIRFSIEVRGLLRSQQIVQINLSRRRNRACGSWIGLQNSQNSSLNFIGDSNNSRIAQDALIIVRPRFTHCSNAYSVKGLVKRPPTRVLESSQHHPPKMVGPQRDQFVILTGSSAGGS
jgi:hypothetical protein